MDPAAGTMDAGSLLWMQAHLERWQADRLLSMLADICHPQHTLPAYGGDNVCQQAAYWLPIFSGSVET
jgi:hypothetical protein